MDHESIEQQQELLAIHRQNLAYYLKQMAQLGLALAPPGVLYGIREARQHIRQIKRGLRQSGVAVEDRPADEGDDPIADAPSRDQENEQAAVYRRLWEQIEEVHLLIRASNMGKEHFNTCIQAINTFAIRNSLYISTEDQLLANKYLKALYQLRTLIDARGSPEEQELMAVTGALTPDDFQSAAEFRELITQLDTLKGALYERVQSIVRHTGAQGGRDAYCTRCGHRVRPAANYCGACGAKLPDRA